MREIRSPGNHRAIENRPKVTITSGSITSI
jgi:hypothetical protein